MQGDNIQEKTFYFAVRVVKLGEYLKKEKQEYIISKQLLRSGTSVGALVREAQNAESKADFIHKLSISLKEARETEYWLLIIKQSELVKCDTSILSQKVTSAIKVLTSIIKTSKKNSI